MISFEEYRNSLNCVVLDLETTGLNPKTDKIIEIGAIIVQQGEIKEDYSFLIHPGFLLQEHTISITKITDYMLQNQPSFEGVMEKLKPVLESSIYLGHNILFDYSFLKKSVTNVQPKGYRFEKMGIDTLKIARVVLDGQQKKSLEALCEFYGIEYNAHRALEDAKATWLLFQILLKEYYEKYPSLFEPKPLNYQVKRDTPIMPKQIEQIKRLHDQIGVPVQRQLSLMTKSEASRYLDQMKATYGVNAKRT